MRRSHIFVGTVVMLLFGAGLVALFLLEPPRLSREPLMLLIGSLNAAFGAVVQYFFGSSLGSAEKTELLKDRR